MRFMFYGHRHLQLLLQQNDDKIIFPPSIHLCTSSQVQHHNVGRLELLSASESRSYSPPPPSAGFSGYEGCSVPDFNKTLSDLSVLIDIASNIIL